MPYRLIMSKREDTLSHLLDRCRKEGMRITAALKKILNLLNSKEGPVTVKSLIESKNIEGSCDPATVYRLLQKLEENSIIRKIGLHDRSTHFILNESDQHRDYVVCLNCGDVEVLEMTCPVEELENQVSKNTGFQDVYHELQFYGICPECVKGKL